jgi:hypothetical protein
LYANPDDALRDAMTPLSPEEAGDVLQDLPERSGQDLFRIN